MRAVLFAAVLCWAALASPGLAAQETGSSPRQAVEDRVQAYNAAKEQHQADSAALHTLRYEWDRLMEQLRTARDRGASDDVARLSGQLQELSPEKTRLEYRWRESEQDWHEKGEWLMDALNDYLGMLDNQIQSSPLGSDDEASNLYNEYEARLDSLEAEVPLEPAPLVPMPEVQLRPEDGPRQIHNKRSLLQRAVEEFTELLADADRDIEALVKRQEREERRRDRQAERDRFGDDEIPTGGNRTNVTGDGAGADPKAGGRKTLEERIEAMQEYRRNVEDELKQIQQQVVEFERKARGRG